MLCEGIGLQQEMQAKAADALEKLPLAALQDTFSDLMVPEKAADANVILKDRLGDDPGSVKILACQLLCALKTYECYHHAGISDKIFFDTMGCFSRFIKECQAKTGVVAFDRGWWTYRQLSMVLFRIGALEYEFRANGTVAIHIPSDANLTEEAVNHSLASAKQFIARHRPAYQNAEFTCRSWLLAPALAELLDRNSRIVQFQRRFSIQQVNEADTSFFEWLFQSSPDTAIADLPEKTTLQRKAKARLLGGGWIGAASGVLYQR